MPLYKSSSGAGATTLAGLTDVDTAGVADEDSLTYESTSSKWVPQAVTGGSGAPTTAPYVTTAADGGLSAEVVIPGLAGSVDKLPASPDADDDEGDVTDAAEPIASWTTFGTVTAADRNTTAKSHIYLSAAASATVRVNGLYKARAVPFTVTAKLAAHTMRADYHRAGIMIGAASPGDLETVGILHDSTVSAYKAEVLDWTNPTTLNTSIATVNVWHIASALSSGRAVPWYLRIIAASSTDVTYQYSYDGIFWVSVSANRNPGFTVASAGLFVTPINASFNVEALFDWVRFT